MLINTPKKILKEVLVRKHFLFFIKGEML